MDRRTARLPDGSILVETLAQHVQGVDFKAVKTGVQYVGKDSVTGIGLGLYAKEDTLINKSSITYYKYLPGDTNALKLIKQELADYFSGTSLVFKSKIASAGTEFQNEVWHELRRVPAGVTRSYQEMAERIGRPTAVRAVANANRLNRCAR